MSDICNEKVREKIFNNNYFSKNIFLDEKVPQAKKRVLEGLPVDVDGSLIKFASFERAATFTDRINNSISEKKGKRE